MAGDGTLANLRLLFAGLPRLDTPLQVAKLQAADWLGGNGLTPRDLLRELGLDTAALDAVAGAYAPAARCRNRSRPPPVSRTRAPEPTMAAYIHQFICLQDNYGVLLHDPETRATATIDAPEAGPILAALEARGWTLTDILVTHHHGDHTGGIDGLKRAYPDVRITGPKKEAAKIGALDRAVVEGDYVMVGALKAAVIETPGHTSGHIVFHFVEEDLLFAGDTLFALGCGRPFEEPPHVLYHSLMKLARLPGSVQVYCGHEYTLGNARFALGVDGTNDLLVSRAAAIEAQRAEDALTLPTTVSLECATNPFLRAEEPAIKSAVGMPDADAAEVFAELRARKNRG